MKGIMGKILWVDLTTREIKEESPTEEIYKQYLGGYGLGAYYIYNHIKPNCDPLGPENILGFIPGLLTGTPAPFTGRYMVCGKSPLTNKGPITLEENSQGGWGDANSGGFFGPAIKKAGYDGIFIKGHADTPVYLYISDGTPQILDAEDLWGKDTVETEEYLKEKHGKRVNTASIGPAGENQSLIAGIVNDAGRIAARSGLGTVMGSKNLKAICLNGKEKIELADKKLVMDLAKEYRNQIKKHYNSTFGNLLKKLAPKVAPLFRKLKMGPSGDENAYAAIMHNLGTGGSTVISAETGDMPIKNWRGAGYLDWGESSRQFSSQYINKYKKRSYGCFGCPIQCGAILEAPELGIPETHRPEYETLGAFGGLILNDDVETVIKLNEYLNRAGMDTISAGGVVAYVLDCVEQGILTQEDFKCESYPDGILPSWHSSDYIIPLLEMMVHREGIGDKLADGTRVASKKIGLDSQTYAVHANGQELPMHDARLTPGLILTYIADPTPGRHTAASLDNMSQGKIDHFVEGLKFKNAKKPYEKGQASVKFTKFYQSFNALGFCYFSWWFGQYPLIDMIKGVTGWETTIDNLIENGWRIQTLRQAFNAREHAIFEELPAKITIGEPPLEKGPLAKKKLNPKAMIQGYYNEIGFTEQGIPKPDIITKLRLEFVDI